ncbi:MAG TPA: hypothetical protein VK737_00725 [Opitutales bacterium]|jgi:multidrug efflux system membrane fusion protein|nr:hypothetical protein [Opitutales bacterium]
MKKTFLGIILGLILGAGAMWLFGPGGAAAAPAKPADAAPAAPDAEPGTVKLESDEQEKADIKTAQPTVAEYKPLAKGFARVLDPASLIADLNDIDADTAAYTASTNEYQRVQTLKSTGNASDRAVEAADAAMRHDGLQLDAAKAHLLAEWGKALTTRADLPDLAKSLLAQDAALIRVDMLAGETLPAEPRELKVAPVMGAGDAVPVEVIGPAPSTDSQAQGVSRLVLLAKSPPAPGTQMLAWMSSTAEGDKGYSLPGSAIVRYEGDTFVYAQVDNELFARWRVKLGATLRDGSVFITSGLTTQDHIVVNGAAQLLSEELKAATGGP